MKGDIPEATQCDGTLEETISIFCFDFLVYPVIPKGKILFIASYQPQSTAMQDID